MLLNVKCRNNNEVYMFKIAGNSTGVAQAGKGHCQECMGELGRFYKVKGFSEARGLFLTISPMFNSLQQPSIFSNVKRVSQC